jgi:hypothetical protein
MVSYVFRGLCVIAASGVFALCAAAPANAAIGPISTTLTVKRVPTPADTRALYAVNVTGVVTMTLAEAQAVKAQAQRPSNQGCCGHWMEINLWGDDPFSDDLLRGTWSLQGATYPIQLTATAAGLRFAWQRGLFGSELNEDPEGRDELYAGVRLLTTPGRKTVQSRTTNVVYGYY